MAVPLSSGPECLCTKRTSASLAASAAAVAWIRERRL